MHGYDVEKEYEKLLSSHRTDPADEVSDYRMKTMESGQMLKVSEFCGDYGWSVQKMNKWLADHGIQYKRAKGASWMAVARVTPAVSRAGAKAARTLNVEPG